MTGVFGHRIRIVLNAGLIALILVVFAMSSASAQEVDDETCLMCHDGMNTHLGRTAHRLSSETENPAKSIACVSCHSGGEVHIEDPQPENILNPATASVEDELATCSQCHQPHTEMHNIGFDPHVGQNLACADCHSVHSGSPTLLIDDNAEFCGQCHVSAVNDFRRRSNHPLTDGNVQCISCHDFVGGDKPNFGHGPSENCTQCHPQQAGPFLYEHEATSSFSTEGAGCQSCHMPHGSPNERLLNQSGDNLCRQCHGIPAGHRTVHDGIGSQYGCMECHSEIHGSFDNRSLLDPYLGSKIGDGPGSCWCHNVDN